MVFFAFIPRVNTGIHTTAFLLYLDLTCGTLTTSCCSNNGIPYASSLDHSR